MYEKHAKVVGKDVQAINYFNYQKLVQVEGGLEFKMATCMDPAGSIPDMLKNKSGARMLRNAERMFHFMVTGEVLK